MVDMADGSSFSTDNPEIIAQIKASTDEASLKTAQAKYDKFMENLTQTVVKFSKENSVAFEEIATNVEKYAERIREAYTKAYGAWNQPATQGRVAIPENQPIREIANAQAAYQAIHPEKIKEVAKNTKDANVEMTQWAGTIKQVAAGLGIFVSIASVVRGVVRILKEAVQNAITFNQSIFTLQTGIRAMQRSGLDVTFESMSNSINKIREEFKVFSTQDIVQGYSLATVKMRQLGASQEQLNTLMDEAGKLAILSGQNISDVAQDISYAITTGYSRTLKNLGIAFSRQMLDAEAAAMGIKGAYTSLNSQTKLLIAQSLIERQLKGYAGDISEYYKTQAGQLEMAQASLKESSTSLGESLLPAWAAIVSKIAIWVDGLVTARDVIKQIWDNTNLGFGKKWNLTQLFVEGQFKGTAGLIKQAMINAGYIKDDQFTLPGMKDQNIAKAIAKSMGGLSEADQEIVQTAFNALKDDYESAYQDMMEKIADINAKAEEDLLKAKEDFYQKSIDLDNKYQQQLDDLATKQNLATTDAYSDYQFDLESIQIDYQNSKADLQEKYNQESLNKEIELQRKLDELRDKAFFDLDEAVRTRDARKARSIIRQYNFDRAQAIKDASNATVDRQAQFQRELADLARQANRRAEERRIEYQRKLDELALEYQREQDQALLNHQRDEAELTKWLEDERNQIRKNQRDEINDAQQALNKKLQKLGEAYVKEYGMNVALVSALQSLWNGYYANTPLNNSAIANFTKGLQNYMNGVNTPTLLSSGIGVGKTGLAANTAITNISTATMHQLPASQIPTSSVPSASGTVQIEVALGDGLIGQIVNSSLQSLRNIIASVVNGGK